MAESLVLVVIFLLSSPPLVPPLSHRTSLCKMAFSPAFSRKTTPAVPGLAEELLILEEQLYRQSCELPYAVDKALDAQLRVDVPMDVDSSYCSKDLESSFESYGAPDSSESDFARARPRHRTQADKENASSPSRRSRARASSVVSYAPESSESDSDDSEYVPSGSAARTKKGKSKGRGRAAARAPTRTAFVDGVNVQAHEPASSRQPGDYYGLFSDEEDVETSSQ